MSAQAIRTANGFSSHSFLVAPINNNQNSNQNSNQNALQIQSSSIPLSSSSTSTNQSSSSASSVASTKQHTNLLRRAFISSSNPQQQQQQQQQSQQQTTFGNSFTPRPATSLSTASPAPPAPPLTSRPPSSQSNGFQKTLALKKLPLFSGDIVDSSRSAPPPSSAYHLTEDVFQIEGDHVEPISAISESASSAILKQLKSKAGTTATLSPPNSSRNNNKQKNNNSTSSNTPTVNADEIVIHVYDEANDVNRDFVCKRQILLANMKYFAAYLSDESSLEDIDISVHCDVNIFNWLMDYAHKKEGIAPLDCSLAVSILISSDFLQMESLVQECLRFVKDHIDEILKLPIDLDCINSQLLNRLAALFGDEELDNIIDKKDKIVEKLFMRKVENLLQKEENMIYRCTLCGKLFAASSYSWMMCSKAKAFIDFHGNLVSQHVPDTRTWDLNKFIASMYEVFSWREIYWKLWALTKSFNCSRCNSKFVACELGHCVYHPQDPSFDASPSSNSSDLHHIGKYPCCGAVCMRFDSGMTSKNGCCAQRHQVTQFSSEQERKEWDVLIKRQSTMLIPFTTTTTTTTTTTANNSSIPATTSSSKSQLQSSTITTNNNNNKKSNVTKKTSSSTNFSSSSSSSTTTTTSNTTTTNLIDNIYSSADQGNISDGEEIEFVRNDSSDDSTEESEDDFDSSDEFEDGDFEDENEFGGLGVGGGVSDDELKQTFKSFSTRVRIGSHQPNPHHHGNNHQQQQQHSQASSSIPGKKPGSTATPSTGSRYSALQLLRRKKKKEGNLLRAMSPRKRKMLEIDSIRQDDDQKMEDIIAMLQSRRKDKAELLKKEKKAGNGSATNRSLADSKRPGTAKNSRFAGGSATARNFGNNNNNNSNNNNVRKAFR